MWCIVVNVVVILHGPIKVVVMTVVGGWDVECL